MKHDLVFTGKALRAFGRVLVATCVVRNELNGWRGAAQVVRTGGSTLPHGLPYQPRQFPPGRHLITGVASYPIVGEGAEFWPAFVSTDAVQELHEWALDEKKWYHRELARTFIGHGYGIHHARYQDGDEWVRSNTTLGCINITDPNDAEWLGEQVYASIGFRQELYLVVPDWSKWDS